MSEYTVSIISNYKNMNIQLTIYDERTNTDLFRNIQIDEEELDDETALIQKLGKHATSMLQSLTTNENSL